MFIKFFVSISESLWARFKIIFLPSDLILIYFDDHNNLHLMRFSGMWIYFLYIFALRFQNKNLWCFINATKRGSLSTEYATRKERNSVFAWIFEVRSSDFWFVCSKPSYGLELNDWTKWDFTFSYEKINACYEHLKGVVFWAFII